jgi:hypothetical protein
MRPSFLLAGLLAACSASSGDGTCLGPGDATAGAATLTAGATTYSYEGLRWGENNDCPAPGSPVISVTISGPQVGPEPSDLGLAFCLPRPQVITGTPILLSDRNQIELVGASGSAAGCVVAPSFGAIPTGTVTFTGFCTSAGASFMMTLAGSIAGTRTCAGGAAENVTLELGGTTLVEPR